MKTQCYSRRNFMKMIGVGTTLALPGHSVLFGRSKTDALKDKPNIIFILTDDQRYDAMSCAGHPWQKTPNMDRLAREGVLFRNAFVTTSLCSPSRGSFLTGCYAHTHEVFRNSGKDPNPSYKTFPKFLQMGGYETAFIGKWHMSREDSPRPGFDHWVSFSGQGRYNNNKINVNGQTVSSETYITDELTNYAVRFLKKDRHKPFMLYLSHKAVHAPFTPARRHASLYSDIEIESRHNPKDNLSTKPKWGRKMDKNWKSQILNYYRSLIAVDESIGRVYKTLEQINALDNTVIIFAGDNGYFHGEHGGIWDKRAAYEPSMRIPLIMRYPRLVKPETVCREMILNIDLAPTILELAGIPVPDTMQGKSWLSVLKGRPWRESFLYEYFQETDRRFKRPTVIAVRSKQWKYVTYPLDNSLTSELYDLRSDPEELDNLVGNPEYADIIDRMKKELAQLQKKTGFRYPSMTEL